MPGTLSGEISPKAGRGDNSIRPHPELAHQFLHTRKARLIPPRCLGVAASIAKRAAPIKIPQIR